MADLVVELYGTRVGVLKGTWRNFDFVPDREAVTEFGIDSQILSVAIPLTVATVRSRKERQQNFFRELLPEGRMLTRLAQQAGAAEQDVIGLLRTYGRDVAGALQIWDPDVPGEPKQPALEPLSSAGVADMLRHVQDNPLGNKPSGGKTSLAGVQDKIVLARTGYGWNRVIDGWPSTHILKPEGRDYPTSIYDEEFGARFTRTAGLTAFPTWIEEFAESRPWSSNATTDHRIPPKDASTRRTSTRPLARLATRSMRSTAARWASNASLVCLPPTGTISHCDACSSS
jgi:serine/threonine-protein kinase HipA